MKYCIFHYPEPIVKNPGKGSALRPNRMLQAFYSIGYEVDEITGDSTERKEKISQIKEKIRQGIKYDFLYSESVNSPTVFSDSDHIPRHPFMDFQFFKFCRKNKIPVALFYRDIHWNFPDIYNKSVNIIKRSLLIPMFRYDLKKYEKCLDLMYLPTEYMKKYVSADVRYKALPPGGDSNISSFYAKKHMEHCKNGILNVLYVGSISNLYDNKKLMKAVCETENIYLTVCTHEDQWNMYRNEYEDCLCDRIKIIHKSSSELAAYYEICDIAVCCLDDNKYLDIAMPIKIIESVSYGTPLLVTNLYSIAEFIKEEDIGWVCETSVESIKEKLEYLKNNPDEIRQKTENTINAAYRNTWEARAQQVVNDLTGKEIKGDK